MLGLWRLPWVLKGLWLREEVLALWVTDDRGCFQGTHLCDCVELSHGAPFSHSQYPWSFSFNTDSRIFSFSEITRGPLGFTGREERETRVRRARSPEWLCAAAGLISVNKSRLGIGCAGQDSGACFAGCGLPGLCLEALREGLAGRLYLLFLDVSPVGQPSLYNMAFIW